ncbi:hypothetical protein ACFV3E_32235 [Streptomyces sp. NPDC059718]
MVKPPEDSGPGFRDNLIYVAVTAMAAIFGFAIQDHQRLHLLLAVCPAAVVLR